MKFVKRNEEATKEGAKLESGARIVWFNLHSAATDAAGNLTCNSNLAKTSLHSHNFLFELLRSASEIMKGSGVPFL